MATPEKVREVLAENGVYPLWSDSMGVKSFSLLVESTAGSVIIDPGAAALQPSFPLPSRAKRELRKKTILEIAGNVGKASYVIVTHYHHDHLFYPDDRDVNAPGIYRGKKIMVKDPNKYINRSQWMRSRRFIGMIIEESGGRLEDYLEEPWSNDFPDPLEELIHIYGRDYGNYTNRRNELLEKGRRWFQRLKALWGRGPWIRDNIRIGDTEISFIDAGRLELVDLRIRFTGPIFHGVEYDRTGWVVSLWIERAGLRIFHSSDLMGPIIEDYANMVAEGKPDIVFMDGPPIYLFPYMFNRINLGRAIDNIKLIIDSGPIAIIYDHHLLRSPRWRKYVAEVYRYAERRGVCILTYAELRGVEIVADVVSR